ncbi:radical SAM protein [Cloacibacillus porcorum]|uniref:radical SAM protein n=1 Tax=Cloacibacillus porcorum TaxID=1197717 RepID=UPI0026741273|nr:radical SAM protein [Cloacibacillus porcorum]
MMVNVRHVKVKNLLSPTKLGADFVINPYIGCPHGCHYCYAAGITRERGGHAEPWGTFLDVKHPAVPFDPAKIFHKEILLSSMTDAYNPYEERAQATRAILRSLLPAQPDITIITKSALVTRDIDLFKEFPHVKVIVSFSSLDDGFRRKMEPHASSPQKKLAALAALKEAGIGTSVMAAPIFPGITDCAALIEAAAPHVSEMNFDTLNLRNQNRESILAIVNTLRPELTGLYNEIYRQGRKDYWQTLREKIKQDCLLARIKHGIFF